MLPEASAVDLESSSVIVYVQLLIQNVIGSQLRPEWTIKLDPSYFVPTASLSQASMPTASDVEAVVRSLTNLAVHKSAWARGHCRDTSDRI